MMAADLAPERVAGSLEFVLVEKFLHNSCKVQLSISSKTVYIDVLVHLKNLKSICLLFLGNECAD
jgi:hypothetical protein